MTRRDRSSRSRRRGPWFTDEDTDATTQRIRAAAVNLLNEAGVEALSFRAIAERPELKVTRTAPLHYFGSSAGLFGAIAEQGFGELTVLLTERLHAIRPTGHALLELAVAYGEYALQHPHLYRAIHAPQLWHLAHKATADRAASNTAAWIRRATAARDRAFAVFMHAAVEAQQAGGIRKSDPGRVARVLTTVVDGYLFQVLEERVGADLGTREHLSELRRLLDLVFAGLAPSP